MTTTSQTTSVNTFELNDNNTMTVQEFEAYTAMMSAASSNVDVVPEINVIDLDMPCLPKRSVKAGSISRSFLNDSRLNDLAGVKDISTLA